MRTDKQLAFDMRQSLDKRTQRKTFTFGMYSLETAAPSGSDKWFAPPFLAISDDVALDAMIEMSKTHPELCHRNVYKVGTFCAVDGKILSCRPQLVVRKDKNHEIEVSDAV